jgi:hypothetical protein
MAQNVKILAARSMSFPFQENLQISFIGVMYEIMLGCLCTKLAIPARPA